MNTLMNETNSRRSFFSKSAALFGAGALATKIMTAQTTTPSASTDLDILNYALALENLEAAFYVNGLSRFGPSDLTNNQFTSVFGTKINNNIPSYITAIRDHELVHVTALKSTITSLGGTPVQPCTYSFGVNNVNDFLIAAMALENTGVMAYDGAISLITNLDVKQAAASIATVEARHASYLNVLNGAIPFPSAFDTPKSKADVLAIAGAYLSSCPVSVPATNPNGPIIRGFSAMVTTVDPQVVFDLSKSSGVNGEVVSFLLTQLSGPRAAITGDRTSQPQAVLLGGTGTYVFQLVVTDSRGNSQTAQTVITYK